MGSNKPIFANKTEADIILGREFEKLLGKNFINILSEKNVKKYAHGQITKDFIKANSGGISQYFYICGPPPMMDAIEKQLEQLKVNKKRLVKEVF